MQLDHKLIETLVLKEISGDISTSESENLRQALENDAAARELAESIRNKVSVEEVKEYFLSNNKKAFTQKVKRKIHQRKKRRTILQISSFSAAAGVIIFAGIWYYSFNYASNTKNTIIASVIQPSNNITLYLPNGKKMTLDSTNQKLKTGDITISTQSQTLTYAANNTDNSVEFATLTVPAGKDYKIQLKDGSQIHLNAATKLRFPLSFKGNSREITIDGEAYIKIAPNTQKPFIVHLPQGTVEVLGTEFNINTYKSGAQKISLVSGSVRVKTPTDNVLLKPGMEAISSSYDIAITHFNAEEVLAWREGVYYIDNATLSELSTVLNRWYGCTVVVDTKEAAIQRFTGVLYKKQPVDLMLKSIQLTNTVHYSTDEKGIIHIK